MATQIDPDSYLKAKEAYVSELERALALSAKIAGARSRNGRDFWGSILFTKLILTGMSLDRLAPPARGGRGSDHWDLASLAMLARGMAENRLMFVYLCVEPETEEEWQFRKTLFNIIDNYSRYRLLSDGGRDPDEVGYRAAQAKLRAELEAMPIFQALPPKRQSQLLRGDRLPYIQDDLVNSLQVDRGTFRSYYRYLSSFVHTGTISFFRMVEHGRGSGEENDYDRTAMFGILDFSTSILRETSNEMAHLSDLQW